VVPIKEADHISGLLDGKVELLETVLHVNAYKVLFRGLGNSRVGLVCFHLVDSRQDHGAW